MHSTQRIIYFMQPIFHVMRSRVKLFYLPTLLCVTFCSIEPMAKLLGLLGCITSLVDIRHFHPFTSLQMSHIHTQRGTRPIKFSVECKLLGTPGMKSEHLVFYTKYWMTKGHPQVLFEGTLWEKIPPLLAAKLCTYVTPLKVQNQITVCKYYWDIYTCPYH